MGGNNARSLRSDQSDRSLESPPVNCAQSANRRTPGAHQSVGRLRHQRELGEGSLEQSSERRNQMLSSRIVLIVTLASAGTLSAQSQAPVQPPVGIKRVPPAALGQAPPKNVPPLLQQYDFG